MSAWPHAEVALALLLLAAGARQEPVDEAGRYLASGRYGSALEAASAIADPALRAEWRFHVLSTGGDLPGALRAASEGLEAAPENPRLLENAVRTALSLGLGSEAHTRARALAALEGLDAATAERAEALLADAEAAERLEQRGAEQVGWARLTAAGLIAAAAVSLLILGRRAPA